MDSDIKKMFELVLNKLDSMDSRFDKIEVRLNSMESKSDKMEIKLNSMDSRQDEIYQVVRAIEHNNQVHKAEIDNILVRTNYLEGTINDIGGVIDSRKAIK